MQFHAGDFFADPLPSADVLVMGHILHDWNMDEKLVLLRKAHDALPDGGALIIYEAIIDDERRANAFGLLMSLNMLIETPAALTSPEPTAGAGWIKWDSARPTSKPWPDRTQWWSDSNSVTDGRHLAAARTGPYPDLLPYADDPGVAPRLPATCGPCTGRPRCFPGAL